MPMFKYHFIFVHLLFTDFAKNIGLLCLVMYGQPLLKVSTIPFPTNNLNLESEEDKSAKEISIRNGDKIKL